MTDERLERLMSVTLVVGVAISALFIALGFGASFVVGWAGSLTGAEIPTTDPTDFSALIQRLGDLQPLALVQTGLIVLIATPIVRVAITAVGFWRERDMLYTVISLAVFGLLVLSITLAR